MKCKMHHKEMVPKVISGEKCLVCEACLIEATERVRSGVFGEGSSRCNLSNVICPYHKVNLTKKGLCPKCQEAIRKGATLGPPPRDQQGRFITEIPNLDGCDDQTLLDDFKKDEKS